MQRTSRTTPRFRAEAIGLTLLAHAAALLLISMERRVSRDAPAPELQFVSIWPERRSELPAPASAITDEPARKVRRAAPERGTRDRKEDSNELARGRPLLPVTTESPVDPPVRSIDWRAAAAEAAARYAEQTDRQPLLGAPPVALREPCKPREFDEETARIMKEKEKMTAEALRQTGPDPVGPDPAANCIIVGGVPKCVQKIGIAVGGRRRAHALSADVQAGKRQDSSVPSPHGCD